MTRKDEVGNQYGKLTVRNYHGPDRAGRALWDCTCECGTQTVAAGYQLRRGSVQSCGCHRADRMREYNQSKIAPRSHSKEAIALALAMLSGK